MITVQIQITQIAPNGCMVGALFEAGGTLQEMRVRQELLDVIRTYGEAVVKKQGHGGMWEKHTPLTDETPTPTPPPRGGTNNS